MRVVFSPAAYDRGVDLVRQVGDCRACGERNIAWICRGHVITRAMLPCEFCGSAEGRSKKKSASAAGIRWATTSVSHGMVVGQNYPEQARHGDLVM